MKSRYYIAYGSNLNISQMKNRCPKSKIIGTSMITDYQLLFKKDTTGSYLTIEKKKGSSVPVALWEINEIDELSLDHYEEYPDVYYKKEMTLDVKLIETGKIIRLDAFVYIMHEDRSLGIPSDAYVNRCMKGYEDFGFDEKYLMDAIQISKNVVKVE